MACEPLDRSSRQGDLVLEDLAGAEHFLQQERDTGAKISHDRGRAAFFALVLWKLPPWLVVLATAALYSITAIPH